MQPYKPCSLLPYSLSTSSLTSAADFCQRAPVSPPLSLLVFSSVVRVVFLQSSLVFHSVWWASCWQCLLSLCLARSVSLLWLPVPYQCLAVVFPNLPASAFLPDSHTEAGTIFLKYKPFHGHLLPKATLSSPEQSPVIAYYLTWPAWPFSPSLTVLSLMLIF